MKKGMRVGTLCVHAGEAPDKIFGAHTTPIYQTSTFVFASAEQAAARFAGEQEGYTYIRVGPNSPTHHVLVQKLAAITAVALTQLEQGDHLLANDVLYSCTYNLFASLLTRFGIQVTFVDMSDLEAVKQSMKRTTKMLFLETPANPTLTIADIAAITKLAREIGALSVVDNTFATPYFQRPLALGADAVVHSCTKYIGGHADLLGGIVIGSGDLLDRMSPVANDTGGTMGPHEAWLCVRGLKTLHLRMERHASNALAVARFLEAHPRIEWVRYPGLPSHPQHEIAKKQMSGFSGMVTFGVKGGLDAGRKLMNRVKLCSLAVSLGAVDTLIEHPASMTHATVARDVRMQVGITDEMVRLSVGIEDAEDIIADLEQALDW
jgi:methionine-gamma-lyase